MDRKDIKLRVKDILTQRGMTNKALADKMGVSPQHVANILSGRGMSVNSLLGIANALDVEFGDLFVSTYSPDSPYQNEFMAMVKCAKGIFTAFSLDNLQELIDSLRGCNSSAKTLMKRTLERRLRFPESLDAALVSEMMLNLYLCMQPTEWKIYLKEKLADLLPTDFKVDYHHLASIASQNDVLGFEKSLT